MSDGDLSFAPLSVPEIQPKVSNLSANRSRFPGRMVHASASAPVPITASRLEIGGTWVQKVEFPVFEEDAGGPESEREPRLDKPVVVKAAGESAHPHPILSPPRPAQEDAAQTVRRKPGVSNRIPVRRTLIEREDVAAPAPSPAETAAPPLYRETVSGVREAKTDPKRIAKIESCFTRLLPPDIAAGPPLPTIPG